MHNLISSAGLAMHVANSEYEGYEIALPVDGLMNSHIAIFGNTGSGKSNTLAQLYQSFISTMRKQNAAVFNENCRVLIFDFNGEYSRAECLCTDKTVYDLSTRVDTGNKIPLSDDGLLDIEMLSIIADATEKTQKPFLRRAHRLRRRAFDADNPAQYTRGILKQQIKSILMLSEKERAFLLIDYLRQILPETDAAGNHVELMNDLDWHGNQAQFMLGDIFLHSHPDKIENTSVFKQVENFELTNDIVSDFLFFTYMQLINDVLANRAQNEHIAPAINKLKSKQGDIRKIFDPAANGNVFATNVVVINLHDVNLEMKKTIPLLISRRIYQEHKRNGAGQSLNIVIDEAHNILSRESSREAESWKDYRLETFEEIIKEGRKFGVFVTIAMISPT